jgi:hypothetical protein
MASNYATNNRFEGLAADGETLGKRLNTMTRKSQTVNMAVSRSALGC